MGNSLGVDRLILYGGKLGTLVLSPAAAATPAMSRGVYAVWSDTDCWISVGPDAAAELTTSTGYFVKADVEKVFVDVRDGDQIGGIVAAEGSGNLYFHRVG